MCVRALAGTTQQQQVINDQRAVISNQAGLTLWVCFCESPEKESGLRGVLYVSICGFFGFLCGGLRGAKGECEREASRAEGGIWGRAS